jgi:diadenylate cyclase
VIDTLWGLISDQVAGFDPVRDVIDIALVAFGVYWLLLLIRGTRAIQILIGLLLLLGANLASQAFELTTLQWILDNFLSSAVLIIIVLFQADIRRALARVGRGVFPVARREETQVAEEVARAAQVLAQRGIGALIVLERETHVADLIEAGTALDAALKRDLLITLFLPSSPLHDGAVVIQGGRIAQAGCILPLTLREDLPEGVGTRHRAAVGITEESDAIAVVVSEETRALSVVAGGVLGHGLDGARLREVLRDLLAGGDAERKRMAELAGRRDRASGTDRVVAPAAR